MKRPLGLRWLTICPNSPSSCGNVRWCKVDTVRIPSNISKPSNACLSVRSAQCTWTRSFHGARFSLALSNITNEPSRPTNPAFGKKSSSSLFKSPQPMPSSRICRGCPSGNANSCKVLRYLDIRCCRIGGGRDSMRLIHPSTYRAECQSWASFLIIRFRPHTISILERWLNLH